MLLLVDLASFVLASFVLASFVLASFVVDPVRAARMLVIRALASCLEAGVGMSSAIFPKPRMKARRASRSSLMIRRSSSGSRRNCTSPHISARVFLTTWPFRGEGDRVVDTPIAATAASMICTGWRAHIFLFRSSRPLASTPTAGALRLRFAVGPAGPAFARSGYRAIRRWGIGILAWRYAFLMPAVDLASLKQHGNPWALGRTCMPAGHAPSKFPGMGMRSGGLQVVPSRRPDRPRSVGRRLAPRRSTGARFFGGAFVPMNMVAASRSKKASSVAYTRNPKLKSSEPVIWIEPVFHIMMSTTRRGTKIDS